MMRPGKLDLLTVLQGKDVDFLDSIGTIFTGMIIKSAEGSDTVTLSDGTTQSMHEQFSFPEGSEWMINFCNYMEISGSFQATNDRPVKLG